eukprot:g4040.t1
MSVVKRTGSNSKLQKRLDARMSRHVNDAVVVELRRSINLKTTASLLSSSVDSTGSRGIGCGGSRGGASSSASSADEGVLSTSCDSTTSNRFWTKRHSSSTDSRSGGRRSRDSRTSIGDSNATNGGGGTIENDVLDRGGIVPIASEGGTFDLHVGIPRENAMTDTSSRVATAATTAANGDMDAEGAGVSSSLVPRSTPPPSPLSRKGYSLDHLGIEFLPRLTTTSSTNTDSVATSALVVREVGPWARRYGLRPGHRIVQCNGLVVHSKADFVRAVAMTPRNETTDANSDVAGSFTVRILTPPLPPKTPSPKHRGRSTDTDSIPTSSTKTSPSNTADASGTTPELAADPPTRSCRHLFLTDDGKWIPLLPVPPEIDVWFNGGGVNPTRRKQLVLAAFPWLEHALLAAYEDSDVKHAAKRLLGNENFTPYLQSCGLMLRLQQHCRAAALRIGARLHDYYEEIDLFQSLGKLCLPMAEGFGGGLKVRQDHPSIRLPLPLHVSALHRSSPNFMRKFTQGDTGWEYFEQESILIHMLRLTALAIDDSYQSRVRQIVENECNGTLKSVAIKGDARMRSKVMSYHDHRNEKKPRPALNVDINRNCAIFETAEDLADAARSLCKAFGGSARIKNMFKYNERLAASKFHYRALMLNLVYDAGINYAELAKRASGLWSTYVSAPPDNPSVPWGLWREEAVQAVRHLKHPEIKKWRVKLICEVQLVLRPYFAARQMMHLFYKVVRASDDKHLYHDFRRDHRHASIGRGNSTGEQKKEKEKERKKKTNANISSSSSSASSSKTTATTDESSSTHPSSAEQLSGHITYESEQARVLNEVKRIVDTEVAERIKGDALSSVNSEIVAAVANRPRGRELKDTLLYRAARQGAVRAVRYLLKECGADPMVLTTRKRTPMHAAVKHGHREVLEILLKSLANKNQRRSATLRGAHSTGAMSLLYRAAEKAHFEILRVLLDYGNEGIDVANPNSGMTPIMVAASHGQYDSVKLLIKRDADVNYRGFGNRTALFVAAKGGFADICELLIERGAEVSPVCKDTDGVVRTPLSIAAHLAMTRAVQVLHKHGATTDIVAAKPCCAVS